MQDVALILLIILASGQYWIIKYKNFQIEILERHNKEVLEDKRFFEKLYKQATTSKEEE